MLFEEITIKDVKLKIGDLIKKLRKNNNLSQEQLAKELDLSRITIQKLENGKNITLDTFLKVFQFFGIMDKFHNFLINELQKNDTPSLY